ncbi:tetratricopeptide repeat protein [Streptomyces sp. NBC_01477]|uniref:tetratricopeptide repeat protein n=1 Tax=Streptomyces sp. NBC_01477 TaxID=2976015 RepID=UPI002E368B9E|nr:tetratricopeptide repeat protein [Streptomyces sp. NBC_01477]
MSEGSGHLWVTGDTRAARAALSQAQRPDVTVDCHRRLRGPYTGAGAALRALLPRMSDLDTAVLEGHRKEILAVAPELVGLIGKNAETLTVAVPTEERTRWFPANTSRRQSHGIVDLLRALTGPDGQDRPLTLAFDTVHEADPTDAEFLAIALRRLDPSRVRLVIGAADAELPTELAEAKARHAHQLLAPAVARPPLTGDRAGSLDAVRAYLASDGTSDDPALIAAFRDCDPAVRAPLHDERVEELLAAETWSARLGAVPWHRSHGTLPIADVIVAVSEPAAYCIGAAYYAAALHLVEPLVERVDPEADPKSYYYLRLLVAQCLGALDRPGDTEAIYWDLLSRTNSPWSHMSMYYALGIIYTRLYDPDHRDHARARAFMNTAVEIAKLLPDPDSRAFHTVFMSNGKALVESHLRRPESALRLVEDGIAQLDSALTPDQHRLHRSVLHHNRSQVLAAVGRLEEAIADLDHVIEVDPMYPEYRFDRGNVLSRLGRYTEALRDYDHAARLGPPFPELFHNRGLAHAGNGDLARAAADFGYVLDLEPDHLEGRISLASLLLDTGDALGAAAVAEAGVALTAEEPRLHCAHGLALLELGQTQEATEAFDRALVLDPGLTAARVNRAIAAYQHQEFDRALDDLSSALEKDQDNPDLLYNRGFVYEALEQWDRAAADYSRALHAEEADRSELLYHRARCLAAAGRTSDARADFRAHLALGDSPYEQEISSLLG